MKVTLMIGGRTRSATVVRRGEVITVAFEDGVERAARTERTRDGGVTLQPVDGAWPESAGGPDGPGGMDQRRTFLWTAGEERHLWVHGTTLTYRRIEAGGAREVGAAGSLSATIPAVVLEVLVSVGDAVEDGQKLLLLESMKMVMPIVAPHAGTVSAVNCGPGDSVAPGVALVELTLDSAPL